MKQLNGAAQYSEDTNSTNYHEFPKPLSDSWQFLEFVSSQHRSDLGGLAAVKGFKREATFPQTRFSKKGSK